MKIICPTINRNENATIENIEEIVRLIENKENPYVILEKSEMTYIQALWSIKGYNLEYQNGNISEHYWLPELTDQESVIWALQMYLKGEPYWKTKFNFEKKEIATVNYKIGYKIGSLFAKAFRSRK